MYQTEAIAAVTAPLSVVHLSAVYSLEPLVVEGEASLQLAAIHFVAFSAVCFKGFGVCISLRIEYSFERSLYGKLKSG